MGNYPLIRFVILFSTGIIFSKIIPDSFIVFIVITFLVICISRFILAKFQNDQILNSLLILLIILCGILYSKLVEKDPSEYPFQITRIQNVNVEGIVRNINLPKEKYFEFIIESQNLTYSDTTFKFKENLFCKLKRDGNSFPFENLEIGDTISTIGTLQKARDQRNPFEFDYSKYLSEQGVIALFYVKNERDIKIKSAMTFNFYNKIYEMRATIAHVLNEIYDDRTSALLKGLLLADRSSIDYETRESFINAGVIHVLAVSGLHVGYIALIFLFLFSRFNLVIRNVFTIIGLILFVLITGAPPSVVRASIMAIVIILYIFSSRQYNKYNALTLAAFLILIYDPQQLFNPGFQLSFSAVLSIFIIYPLLQKRINEQRIKSNLVKAILLFLSVSFAAQVGTLPFTLIYFHKFSIVALFANLFVIPLIGAILAIGIVSLIIYPLIPLFAMYYVSTNELLSLVLFWIVNLIGEWEYAFLYVPQFSLFDAIIFYLFISLFILFISHFRSLWTRLLFVFLLGINCFLFIQIDDTELMPDNILSLMMIDIGQGDSFLLKFPNSKTALVDAGNASFGFDNGERIIKPLLNNLSITHVDYGFVSHADADHYKGFESLIINGLIDTIFKPPTDSVIEKDVKLDEYIRNSQTELKYSEKEILNIGNTRLYILTSDKMFEKNFHDLNEKSTVMKLVFGETSILFTGDAGKKVEREYIDIYGSFLKCDVLKAGHHGSNTSTRKDFFNIVSPKIALISCGLNNKFNHPSKETLKLINANKTQIMRTDLHRAVILHSDGENIWVQDWR